MSNNIHGVNDYPSNRRGDSQYPMMGGYNSPSGDPRREGFGKFLRDFCCPAFTFRSFIFIISCVDLAIYLVTIFNGIKMNPNELLAPTSDTLDKFGMKVPLKIQQGQIWRLITCGFLHANLVHVVLNLFSQIIIGSFIESILGTFKTITLYFLSGIGGCLFSCMVSNSNGVGASISIYGLLGAYLSYFIINWNALDRTQGDGKYFNLMFLLFIIMLNISFGFTNPTIDNYGHLGGLIFGFFLMFIIHAPEDPNDGMCCNYRIWYWISFITLLLLYGLFILLFFFVKKIPGGQVNQPNPIAFKNIPGDTRLNK